jgi:hypothetical protein
MTMKYTVHVVITTDNSQTETREIASVEREDLTPTTLGLTLAEGKAILKGLQAVVRYGNDSPLCAAGHNSGSLPYLVVVQLSRIIRALFPTTGSATGLESGSAPASWNRRSIR